MKRVDKVRPFLVDSDLDLEVPLSASVNFDTYDIRRNEGIVELKGGLCPYFRIPKAGEKGCNHCSLPTYSTGHSVDAKFLKMQIDSALGSLQDALGSRDIKTLSMYNGGSAFNPGEIPREALFYFFERAAKYRDKKVFPVLDKVSIESREAFVNSDLLGRSVDALDGITLEVALGFESYNEEIRNGDFDNSGGRIGLNKRIDIWEFERAVGSIGEVGAEAKFYVMMGAVPWLDKKESAEDVLNSVKYLHNLSISKGIPTFIHLNPMYTAKGSALYDVWNEAYSKGKSLPNCWDVVRVLEKIDSGVAKFGSGNIYVYLGLDSEGLDEFSSSEHDGDKSREALIEFNKTQDLESLVCFIDDFEVGLK